MEVHHHSHSVRRKWTHYFWEFMMLFLAVFCGFLAEYQLEHKIEHDREKQYINSLVEDLQSDTAQLNSLLDLFSMVVEKEDSLISALASPSIMEKPGMAYPYLGYPMEGYAFHRSERTIQQLKNAGGLRLIRENVVSNRINEYDEACRKSGEINLVLIQTYHQYIQYFNEVVDAEQVGFPYREDSTTPHSYRWLTNEVREIRKLYNSTVNIQWVTKLYYRLLDEVRKQGIELMQFLTDRYNL